MHASPASSRVIERPETRAALGLVHVGNLPGPGAGLVPDLMNGVQFDRGTRYTVSSTDLDILSDVGVGVVAGVGAGETRA